MSRALKCHENQTRIEVTLHEDQCTFLNILDSALLGMKRVSDKICREIQNTFHVQYLPPLPPPKIAPFVR